jgi:GLPGLI family protein
MRSIFWLLLVSMFLATGVSAQGMYYESVLKGGPFGDKGVLASTYMMPKLFKHVNGEDKDFMVVFAEQQKMVAVNVKAKTYWEMTFAEMEKAMKGMSSKMDAKMAEMETKMKDMPAEQRKMMEQMMGSKMGKQAVPVELVKTGEKKSISGYSCTKCIAKEGEKELMTFWVTKDIKGFESLKKDYDALSNRMNAMNPQFAKGLIEAMKKIDGFPMQTEWGGFTNLVTKVEARQIPASEFSIPAGYKKEDSPMKMGMME